jgi:GNAT superfamily N-acetyltransferase
VTDGRPTVTVREATAGDRDFVLRTCVRLGAVDPPGWRSAGEIVAGETRTLHAFFDGAAPRSTLLVARTASGPAGFAFLEEIVDYFTRRPHGHLGMIAVADDAEGQGVGRALMEAAERWARERGYGMLTLNVFAGNARARRLYARSGFGPETVRYVKAL